ncbi:PepSY domain-containing protein [Aquibacillus salsiterrae]|uniref:PepSY domain-containing protein n=1 Tax=Aquibacillus salsiterrae TaxID=2950439 RepID=A0A9X4AGI9_9BACI|nr:PepSY domain-containing protein [Aquibacillus salsiterrae]MDC3417158.1 PepSY domain-containing protein [Aquibacillus salsiterrae]
MKKKFIVPALAVAIAGGGLAGTVLNSSVFAATDNSKVEVSDQKEQKQLEKEATITEEQAITVALQEVKGTAGDTELENEDGTVVYGVEVTDDQGEKQDVKVDAKTGKVVKVDKDDEDEENGEDEQESDNEIDDEE